jgi:hypothetical protein
LSSHSLSMLRVLGSTPSSAKQTNKKKPKPKTAHKRYILDDEVISCGVCVNNTDTATQVYWS